MSCFTCIVTLQVFVKIWIQWSIAWNSAFYRGWYVQLWIVFSFIGVLKTWCWTIHTTSYLKSLLFYLFYLDHRCTLGWRCYRSRGGSSPQTDRDSPVPHTGSPSRPRHTDTCPPHSNRVHYTDCYSLYLHTGTKRRHLKQIPLVTLILI